MRKAHDAWQRFRSYLDRDEHWHIGLMTGTSGDAIDAALVRFRGAGLDTTYELRAYRETPFDDALRAEILAVAGAESTPLERVMALDAALGHRYADAVESLLETAQLDASHVDAIGSHGQTVRHIPRAASDGGALTLQVGSAAILAERTGITVVSDFRSRDTAAGGEGAPLVPLVDWWLFRSDAETRVMLNLGGMANITVVPKGGGPEAVVAFDTGPGNAVLDALAHAQSGGARRYDPGGATAALGAASDALLAELLADPFFAQAPPRSTGRERFGEHYAMKLREVGNAMGLSDEDVLATAVELTAASVAISIQRFVMPPGEIGGVFASGGGVHNVTLMRALERRLMPAPVRSLLSLGVKPESKEALAFAFLAHQTLCGAPGNLPNATGAERPVVLGHITPGAGS